MWPIYHWLFKGNRGNESGRWVWRKSTSRDRKYRAANALLLFSWMIAWHFAENNWYYVNRIAIELYEIIISTTRALRFASFVLLSRFSSPHLFHYSNQVENFAVNLLYFAIKFRLRKREHAAHNASEQFSFASTMSIAIKITNSHWAVRVFCVHIKPIWLA